jgi:hypothetical protein
VSGLLTVLFEAAMAGSSQLADAADERQDELVPAVAQAALEMRRNLLAAGRVHEAVAMWLVALAVFERLGGRDGDSARLRAVHDELIGQARDSIEFAHLASDSLTLARREAQLGRAAQEFVARVFAAECLARGGGPGDRRGRRAGVPVAVGGPRARSMRRPGGRIAGAALDGSLDQLGRQCRCGPRPR